MVIGQSAGSVAAPQYAGLVADQLPNARVTVLANASASYPDDPRLNSLLANAWGVLDALPEWPELTGMTAEEWSLPGLFVTAGRHDPDIVFARVDFAFDANQAFWYQVADLEVGDLLSHIDDNEAMIESAGVNLASYTAPGEDHIALTGSHFYTLEVNGQPLVDWVDALIAGEPVDDVHCTDCRSG